MRKPPYWRVRIIGPRLDVLTALLTLPDLSTEQDGESVFLVSNAFDGFSDAVTLRDYAETLLPRINGAGALMFDGFKPFALGPVDRVREDGSKSTIVIAKGAIRIALGSLVAGIGTVTSDGIEKSAPVEHEYTKAVRLAADNAHVDYVLALLAEPNWYNLYKIHERMQSTLGKGYLPTIERTAPAVSRFTQTANYNIRHDAVAKGWQPHKNAMTEREAADFIKANVKRWLASFS